LNRRQPRSARSGVFIFEVKTRIFGTSGPEEYRGNPDVAIRAVYEKRKRGVDLQKQNKTSV
jgi:hypothetical protein